MGSAIKQQLGDSWSELHPNIQTRFSRDPAPGEEFRYHGHIDTQRSCAGWTFAHFTRLIGNPLTPYRGTDIPLTVRLFQKTGIQGIHWERNYQFPGKKPYLVTSIKKLGRTGEMLECVGGGFGMVLSVYAENQQLHFKSTRYFWQIGRFRLPLPHCITPGQTHVIHAEQGHGEFQFKITMTHRCLGQTFYQNGVFRREGE